MIRRSWLIVAILAALLTGCGPTPSARLSTADALPVGTSSHQLSSGGLSRSYLVHRPATPPPSGGYPLVVMLHGGLGSAAQAERSYGWDAVADQQGFVVVYPDGIDRTWNAGTCCGRAQRDGVDDVGFLSTVVTDVAKQVAIDPKRRFVTGMSNGAMMSYRLACQTTIFAAFAPVAGTQLSDCRSAAPSSLLAIHGADDDTVRLDGRAGSGAVRVVGPPLSSVLDGWRKRDGCESFTTTVAGAVTTRTATCPSARTVTWIVIAGAGHQWPGSTGRGYPGADTPSTALDATATIWSFFVQHPAR